MNASGSEELRIAIDCRLTFGEVGGVAQATMAIVNALGRLDGPESYSIIIEEPSQATWISPHLGSRQKLVQSPPFWNWDPRRNPPFRRFFDRLPFARRFRQAVNYSAWERFWPDVPVSDGFIEGLGCAVVHFPTQRYVLSQLPTIYNPHDVQHLHYPEFFSLQELARRETTYPMACRLAHTVIVGSRWIKRDILKHYRVSPSKVQVIPLAPPTQMYPEPTERQVADVEAKYHLKRPFVFYPAVTWPHKNHIRLFHALVRLRETAGLRIPLICTGYQDPYSTPALLKAVKRLNLSDQVRFLGLLPEGDMRAMYRLAESLVLPSLFEADSCPIHEAWVEGLPVVCSNSAAIPDQVRDAGLLFDATDVDSIANALARVHTDAQLRKELVRRGYERVSDFSWERTAMAYRAVYRRAARQTLSEEDRHLLAWDWMREPRRLALTPSPDDNRPK